MGLEREQWVNKLTSKGQKVVSFSEALLYPITTWYVIYRLRYFVASNLFAIFLHIIEFYYLFRAMPSHQIGSLILVRALVAIFSSSWWGALEVFREQVRSTDPRDSRQRSTLLGCWLIISTVAATASLIICLTYVIFALKGNETTLNLLIALQFFSLGLSYLVATWRSYLFALHRIQRFLSSLIIPPSLGGITLLLLWPYVGKFALVISGLLTLLAGTAYSLYFMHLSSKVYGIHFTFFPSFSSFKQFLADLDYKEFLSAGIANVFINLENVLLWIMFYSGTESLAFFLLFYLISPLSAASSNWARLFYFDIKKYDTPTFHYYMKVFHDKVRDISMLIGFFFWSLAVIVGLNYFPQKGPLLILLLLFFILRSGVAYQQIAAFSQKRYDDVCISGGLIILAMVGILLNVALYWQLGINIFFFALSYWYSYKPRLPALHSDKPDKRLSDHVTWLKSLVNEEQPTRVLRLSLARKFTGRQYKCIINICKTYMDQSNWAALDKNVLVGITGNISEEDPLKVVLASGGLIENFAITPLCENGYKALQSALDQKMLEGKDLIENLDHPLSINHLIDSFKSQFPYAYYSQDEELSLETLAKKFFQKNEKRFYRIVLNELKNYLLKPLKFSVSSIAVSSIYVSEKMSLTFVIPLSHENKKAAKYWSELSFQHTIRNVIDNYRKGKESR